MINLDTYTIASIAYKSVITDGSLINVLDIKNHYEKQQRITEYKKVNDTVDVSHTGRRSAQRSQVSDKQAEEVWSNGAKHRYTGNQYRRSRIHLGLRTRIARNSGNSLPAEIRLATAGDISSKDESAITSYTTPSRGIRKCCLTVFAAASKMAIRNLGAIKNCSERPYSCKQLSQSVLDLGKNTSAGLDTMGKKNDPIVQKRVLSQVRSIFRKPTSYSVLMKNPSLYDGSQLNRMFNLPEVIFHRFQATYSKDDGFSTEKSRLVWGCPYTIVSVEAVFFQKHIDSCLKFAKSNEEVIYPIGLTNFLTGQRAVQTLRSKFRIMGKGRHKIYSLDFSRFDQTIPNWAKDLFFSTTLQTLDLQPNEKKVFDLLRIYMKHTPFIDKDGIKYKRKGISSGMLITNLFDSWWNLTIFNFVEIILYHYPEVIDEIFENDATFDKLYLDKSKVKIDYLMDKPYVRVMGDDLLVLCDEYKLHFHRKVCESLGLRVTIKEVTEDPDDPIFFLGRYWDKQGLPFQTEEYISLRICYTKWYNEKDLPFSLDKLHLNRILSICLPLTNGKEFLDKYLFDYEPYVRFKESEEGFT
jgi:hypothetical protein